jgi:hypothetical protein
MAAFNKQTKHDPIVPTILQPKVTLQFNKEVCSRDKVYVANVDYDLPLDEAHTFSLH